MEFAASYTLAGTEELNRKLADLAPAGQVRLLNQFLWDHRHKSSGLYFDLARRAVDTSLDQADKVTPYDMAMSWFNLGNCAWNRSEASLAYDSLTSASRIFQEIGDTGKACFAEIIIANLHAQKGEFEQAFELVFRLLDEIQGKNECEVEGLIHLSAGSFHFDLESYQEAIPYFESSLECFRRINDLIGIARATNNAGMSLYKCGDMDRGLEFCNQSMEIYRRLNLDPGLAKTLRDIGKILHDQKKPAEALDFYRKSLEIREKGLRNKSGNVVGVITCLMDIGSALGDLDRPEESNEFLQRALKLSEEAKALPKQVAIHQCLSETFKKLGDVARALHHLEAHLELRKEMMGLETANKIQVVQTRYALDLAQKESELEKAKNEELNQAYTRINTINKNLTDSLNYAKRIQNAFLPSRQRFRLTYPSSFILNLPKDIVSGDFYWITQKNGFHLLAVADCAGHGVPGAFMSMVGMSLLNQIVNERGVLQPGKILNQVNLALINNLNQMNEEGSADGMDLGLCVFDPGFTQVVYAGSKRPLYYMANGELNELRSTPISIGYDPYTDFSERTHTLNLNGVDQLFLSTDGYSDQFGAESGKKLLVSRFKQLLQEHAGKSPEATENILRNYYYAWKGDEAQTDDVLVVGINLNRSRP